jgi:hypothetical protein
MDHSVGRDERRGPESYTWPLVVVVAAVLPQAVIPAQYRVGPPLVVPVIETVALLVLLAIVAKPRSTDGPGGCSVLGRGGGGGAGA